MNIAFTFIALLTMTGSVLAAQATSLPSRQLKYPLKTARTLYSDEQIARARANIAKYPAAKKIADAILKDADQWSAWKDEDLTFLLTSPDVPRAFAVSATGCPVCGGKIRQKGNGDYNWLIDPKLPFKIKCPVDGTVFPTNDYAAYYRSGFTEKKDWDTQYVDDGWGWADPKTGEKYWFVAYYNHWMWHKHLVPGLLNLGRAYMLTGDAKYAHKATIMLERIAQVYPGMDHAKQSRYGTMMAARGIDYPGKVVNKIWETSLAQALADAYDAVWETIDRDEELQKETGKTGEQIRKSIEANILEDAIDAVFNGKIRGNFGMHQGCLVHLALVRQTGETKKWFDGLANNSTTDYPVLGLNYALYNLISRDGIPSEQAPGYNNIWVKKISDYADLLQRGGVDVYGIPKTKRLYDGVIDQINVGTLTPSLGDSMSVWGGLVGADAETYQTAWRHYKDPRYAAFLAQMHATGEDSFKSFDSLFEEPIEAPAAPADAKLPPAKPRLLDGCGMAILNNPADTISMAMSYGQHHGHGHFDRLTFEIFANGVPIMPDLGYPDAMNEFVSGIYTWSKNTISHNTVVVDAGRQTGNVPGEVQLFADSPFARIVEVEAKGTYPGCMSYRRAMIMVDVDQDHSYFVDIFTAIGGKQHDYSLHGPPGDFAMVQGTWSEPAKGTLAGPNVELGKIYDNAELAAHGEKTGYSSYLGSGFQHLYNVRTPEKPDWVLEFAHEKNPSAKLRIRMLDQPDQKIMLAEARVSPVNFPQVIRYLITRRQGDYAYSHFVSVLEPFKDKPFIQRIAPAQLVAGEGGAVEVFFEDGSRDIVAYNYRPPGGVVKDLKTDGQPTASVTHFDAKGKQTRVFAAKSNVGGMTIGKVDLVLPTLSGVQVALDANVHLENQLFAGNVVRFVNDRHATAHQLASVKIESGRVVMMFKDDVIVGQVKIAGIEPSALAISTAVPLFPAYRGVTLADEMFRFFHPVSDVVEGKINLAKPLAANQPLKVGDKAWLVDVGPGDRVEVPWIHYQSNEDKHDGGK